MSGLLPLAAYNLKLEPFDPQPALSEDFPVTIRLTLAAIDPDAVDDKEEPSTLRILKRSITFGDIEDDEFSDAESEGSGAESDSDAQMSEDEEEKEESGSEKEESGSESGSEEGSDLSDDEDDDVEEFVVCTLSPKHQFQQTIDLTITADDEVYFVVTGSYPIHLTGNYVEHPYDNDSEDFGSDSEDEEFDSEDYDLTPDEDELLEGEDFDLSDLDDVEDVEGRIEEIIEEEEKKKSAPKKEAKKEAKDSKKRPVEEEQPAKETKKSKKEAKKEKVVQFNEQLEQGPTKETKKAEKKFPTKTLTGGVVIEDRTTGTGPVAKNGNKVGVRYIGKLKNGKVFDKNTSGKPFTFGLGKGEVIKGWDVGVAGMAVGGERRIIVPAAMAYGSKKLPGIPANSELTFDVKLLSIK